jgi:hypothetical protein
MQVEGGTYGSVEDSDGGYVLVVNHFVGGNKRDGRRAGCDVCVEQRVHGVTAASQSRSSVETKPAHLIQAAVTARQQIK